MLLIGELMHEMTDKEFSPEELANSNRIFKSATPKYDWSWWIKWFGSIAVLIAVSIRSTGLAEFILYDLVLSLVGAASWLVVGLMWKDRALIILNGVITFMLLSGLIKVLVT